MKIKTRNDRQLLQRVARKDRTAFEELYRRYYRRLFSYIFRVTRRSEMVEEVVNDVLLTVWLSADRFANRSKPSTWIFGIAYRKALKALNRRGREEPAEEAEMERAQTAPAVEGPMNVMMRRELSSTLGKALASLSTEQRSVVELTYFQELSYPEIAEIIGCPVNTVKTRMFHARKRLRTLLPSLGWAEPYVESDPR